MKCQTVTIYWHVFYFKWTKTIPYCWYFCKSFHNSLVKVHIFIVFNVPSIVNEISQILLLTATQLYHITEEKNICKNKTFFLVVFVWNCISLYINNCLRGNIKGRENPSCYLWKYTSPSNLSGEHKSCIYRLQKEYGTLPHLLAYKHQLYHISHTEVNSQATFNFITCFL